MADKSSVDDVFVPKQEDEDYDTIAIGSGSKELDKEFLKAINEFFSDYSKSSSAKSALSGAFDIINSSCILSSLPVNGTDDSRSLYYADRDRRDQIREIDADILDIGRKVFSRGTKSRVYFRHPIGDPDAYERDAKEVAPYIPTMRNLVRNMNKNYDFCIHGQREGKLDTTKLVEAYQGVPQVYTKTGVVRTSGVNICVVVDESGSMSGYRDSKARKAAILMNEAFGNIPGVDLYIYGHSADIHHSISTDIYIYREPGIPYLRKMGTGLSEVNAKVENRDGEALREIATRVRKFTSQPVLMFVLSDGCPCANDYWGMSAIEDVGKAVKEISDKGFYPIQITINNSELKESIVRKMFSTFIDLTDELDELPKSLATVVRKEISKALQDNQSLTTV